MNDQFISWFWGGRQGFFRCIWPISADNVEAVNLSGTYQQQSLNLQTYSEAGYGVFFLPNEGGKNDESINRFNAFFLDIDGDKGQILPATWHIKPSVILKRENNYHVYWLLNPTADHDKWRNIEERLVDFYNADRAVKNASRVLRLPGFKHTKPDSNGEPYTVHATYANRYDIDDLTYNLPELPQITQRDAKPAQQEDSFFQSLEYGNQCLNHISPNCEYSEWVNVIAGFTHQFGTSQEVVGILDLWSSQSDEKYAGGGEVLKKINSFKRDGFGSNVVTFATVVDMAKKGGFKPVNSAMNHAAQQVFGQVTQGNGEYKITAERTNTFDLNVTERDGYQLMMMDGQRVHFSGCVYVSHDNRVFDTKRGLMLKPDQFRAVKGGYEFHWKTVDSDIKTTNDAWKAFTESQIAHFPKVDQLCFDPTLPTGEIITHEGLTRVNTYIDLHGERIEGDVTPFMNHLTLLIPDEGDREIILSWCAHVVQNVGEKPKWSPVLIGCEGNGKSLVADCIVYAVGQRWTVKPKAEKLVKDFNAWIENKLLAVVEEVHTRGRMDVMDQLKPLITEKRIEIEGKGRDQYTGDNRCAFFMCSNHADAVVKHKGDRRYSVFFTGQMDVDNLTRDGMDEGYFTSLWGWLDKGGYAHVAHYLSTLKITVNMLGRAPNTTSTVDAIEASRSPIEDRILNAIEQCVPGFCGDVIILDSVMELLRDYKMTRNKISRIIRDLGYDYCSGAEGRIRIGEKLYRVYVKKNSLVNQIEDKNEILRRSGFINKGLTPFDKLYNL